MGESLLEADHTAAHLHMDQSLKGTRGDRGPHSHGESDTHQAVDEVVIDNPGHDLRNSREAADAGLGFFHDSRLDSHLDEDCSLEEDLDDHNLPEGGGKGASQENVIVPSPGG